MALPPVNPTWYQDLNSASQTIKPQVFDSSTLHQRAEYIRNVKAFPHKPEVWRQYLLCLNNDRRTYLRVYPDDMTHHIHMYQALQKLYELATSVIPMSAANRHSPEYTQLWLDLAALRGEDDPDDAAATFKRMKSLRIGQTVPQFWNTWADFEARINNHDRAARIRKKAAACVPATNSTLSTSSTPFSDAKRTATRPPRRVAPSNSTENSLTKNPSPSITSDPIRLSTSETSTVQGDRICLQSSSFSRPPSQTSREPPKESMSLIDKSEAETPSNVLDSKRPAHGLSPEMIRSHDVSALCRIPRDTSANADVSKRSSEEAMPRYHGNVFETPDGQRRVVEMHRPTGGQPSRSHSVPKSHDYQDRHRQDSILKAYQEQRSAATLFEKYNRPRPGSHQGSPRSSALAPMDANVNAVKFKELTSAFESHQQMSQGENTSNEEAKIGKVSHGVEQLKYYSDQFNSSCTARELLGGNKTHASNQEVRNVVSDHGSRSTNRNSERSVQASDSSSEQIGRSRQTGSHKGRDTGSGALPYGSTSHSWRPDRSTNTSACPTEESPVVRFFSGVPAESLVVVNGVSYLILELVGKGGSSKVFKVLRRDMRIFALKRVKVPQGSHSNALIDSYANEIALLQKLRAAPTIIDLYDAEVSREHGIILLVMEYGDTDLAKLLLRNKDNKVDDNFRRLYWHQMLEAVSSIHKARIIHGDLKPANFIIVQGTLKLIDFGIARAIVAEDTTKIVRDSQVGTPNYMAPEALCEEDDGEHDDDSQRWTMTESAPKRYRVGRASDVWSLGCILYQMVYGRAPFAHIRNTYRKLKYIQDPDCEIPYKPVSNPLVLDVLRGCLQRDPSCRMLIPQLLEHPFITSSAESGRYQSRGVDKDGQTVRNARSVVINVFGFLRQQGYEKLTINGQNITLRTGSAPFESIVDDLVQHSTDGNGVAAADAAVNLTKNKNPTQGRAPRTPTASGVTIVAAIGSPEKSADVPAGQSR